MSQFEFVLNRNFQKFTKEYRDISSKAGGIYAKNNSCREESPSHTIFALKILVFCDFNLISNLP